MIRSFLTGLFFLSALVTGSHAAELPVNSALVGRPFGEPLIPDLIADPSVVEVDGVFYCYATTDGLGAGLSSSGLPVVWKSKDFLNWSFEGSLFPDDFDAKYWAPSSLVRKGGDYFLFPTLDEKITTLVSKSPVGPFLTLDGKAINKKAGWAPMVLSLAKPIDAEVLLDDDGAAYMAWAQRGIGKLKSDFSGLEGAPAIVKTKREGYSEGPFLFKRKGVYYYLYTLAGHERYQYAYMMSRISPLGPWEAPEQDIIARSDASAGVYGPGHGCFFKLGGTEQWFFVYLEYGRGGTNRQIWADRMEFNEDGTIRPIRVTNRGVGALRSFAGQTPNLAKGKDACASSQADDVRIKPRYAETVMERIEKFDTSLALDESNGSRWMAAPKDQAPWFQIDLGKITVVNRTEAFFVKPTEGHAYSLEYSVDGSTWFPYGGHADVVKRSPHVELKLVAARYLRLRILSGTAGLWEFKVY